MVILKCLKITYIYYKETHSYPEETNSDQNWSDLKVTLNTGLVDHMVTYHDSSEYFRLQI